MAKRRGNPNWGKPEPIGPVVPTVTSFEQVVKEFKLTPINISAPPDCASGRGATRIRSTSRKRCLRHGDLRSSQLCKVGCIECDREWKRRRPCGGVFVSSVDFKPHDYEGVSPYLQEGARKGTSPNGLADERFILTVTAEWKGSDQSMKRTETGKVLATLFLGVMFGIYRYVDQLMWLQRGRDAFMAVQSRRFERTMEYHSALGTMIAGNAACGGCGWPV